MCVSWIKQAVNPLRWEMSERTNFQRRVFSFHWRDLRFHRRKYPTKLIRGQLNRFNLRKRFVDPPSLPAPALYQNCTNFLIFYF